MSDYQIGDTVRLSTEITTISDGLDYDPSQVRIVVRLPDGSEITKTYPADVEVVRDSAGHYHYDLSLTLAGTYRYVWRGLTAGGVSETATRDVGLRARQSVFSL